MSFAVRAVCNTALKAFPSREKRFLASRPMADFIEFHSGLRQIS